MENIDLQNLVIAWLNNKNNKILAQILTKLAPLINKKARWLSNKAREDYDDMRQEVIIAVMKRLQSYDITKGKFLTYLINTMRGDPTDILQTKVCKIRGGDGKKLYATPLSLDAPLNTNNDGKEKSLLDCLADWRDPYSKIQEADLKKLLEKYSIKEIRDILKKEVL